MDGSSSMLLLGEPGIGKTIMLRAGLEAAEQRSLRILTCQPAASERELSFAGLDDLIGVDLPEALPELPEPQQRAIRAALLLEEAPSVAQNPRAIALGVLGVLRALARRAPVLVAVDDLQWVDPPSVSALAYAIRRLEEESVGLLATVRMEQAGPGPSVLEEFLPNERMRTLPIGPLSLGALHRLIVRRLGRALSRPALVRVHTVSGGNPFYALEMARALSRSGGSVDPGRPLPVPENLRDLLKARLAALPQAAREVLPAVAALANPTVSAVEAVGRPGRAGPALEAAAEAGIVEILGERVRFTHPLLASAAYSRLPPRRRRELHRRLAPLVSDPEERARHLALGADGPDEAAAGALERAAGQAARRGAPDVAAELAEMASNMTPPEDPHTRVRRMAEAANQRNVAGELDRAHAMAEELLEGALVPTERADLLLLLADTSTDSEVATAFAERAAMEASADPARSVHIRQLIAQIRLVYGTIPMALAEARRALEFAERQDDLALLVSSLSLVAAFETWAGEITPGLLDRALALLLNIADENRTLRQSWELYYQPDFVDGLRLMYQGRLDEARQKILPTYTQAAAVGDEPNRVNILIILTELECRSGNWDLASRYAAEGWEISEQIGLEHQGGAHAYTRALVQAHRGRVKEARVTAERGLAMSEAIGDEIFSAQNASVLGFLDLSLGDPAAADRRLRPLADRLEALGWGEPGVYCVLPNAIEALVARGELGEARRLLRRLETQSRATGSAWADATARRCRGLLMAAEGDLSRATAVLVEALETHRRLPLPFEHARSLLVLGSCQRRAKQKGAARRTLQAALELFQGLGASLWAERTRAELGRIGGRAPSPLELTATERRVASLVARGLPNKEVAAELFVTIRTVEAHLSRIYGKLGVRSRAELAHRLASSGWSGERTGTTSRTDLG